MDGKTAGDLLAAVIEILESDQLLKEAEATTATADHQSPVLPLSSRTETRNATAALRLRSRRPRET